MKGDRDGKSATTSEQETAYSAVVVNNHMYPPSIPISFFHVSMTPFGSKTIKGGDTYDHSLQLQFLVPLVVADLATITISLHFMK